MLLTRHPTLHNKQFFHQNTRWFKGLACAVISLTCKIIDQMVILTLYSSKGSHSNIIYSLNFNWWKTRCLYHQNNLISFYFDSCSSFPGQFWPSCDEYWLEWCAGTGQHTPPGLVLGCLIFVLVWAVIPTNKFPSPWACSVIIQMLTEQPLMCCCPDRWPPGCGRPSPSPAQHKCRLPTSLPFKHSGERDGLNEWTKAQLTKTLKNSVVAGSLASASICTTWCSLWKLQYLEVSSIFYMQIVKKYTVPTDKF